MKPSKRFSEGQKKVLVDIDKSELMEENKVKIDCKINTDLSDFVAIFKKYSNRWR